jgi:hypothetical protein
MLRMSYYDLLYFCQENTITRNICNETYFSLRKLSLGQAPTLGPLAQSAVVFQAHN